TRYCFGDDAAELGDYAWRPENSEEGTYPVGQKAPNAWGLYDMHGNVWEWCWDGFDANYYRQSPAADPSGPLQAAARVVRGGSWDYDPPILRSAFRGGSAPGDWNIFLGFRVARVLSGK